MQTVFFYGLFMDRDLLEEKGFNPRNSARACLNGYQLKIGERATLVVHESARCYGTVMELDSDELENLYGSDDVEDYVPQAVIASTMAGEPVEAISYILPMEKISASHGEYAIKLAGITRKLDLPAYYIDEIEAWI